MDRSRPENAVSTPIELPDLPGPVLQALSDYFWVESAEYSKDPSSPDIAELSEFTQSRMAEMNAAFPGLPPDTFEKTRELVTQPGAHTFILRGVVPGEADLTPRILGYGIVILGVDNFPDKNNIPPELLTNPNASRVIRLFVTNEARQVLPNGEAFTKILDQVKRVGGEGPIIGMVLTDIVPIGEAPMEIHSLSVWREAQRALEVRGFEDTGKPFLERIEDSEGKVKEVLFHWYVYPPFTAKGKESHLAHDEHFEIKRQRRREALSSSLAAIPLSDARVLVHSKSGHACDLAERFPADFVLGVPYNLEDPARAERRFNLLLELPQPEGRYLPSGSVDAVVCINVLPDVRESLDQWMPKQVDQTKNLGMFVISDTIGPNEANEVEMVLSKEFAESFRRFKANPIERYITPEEWKSIVELDGIQDNGKYHFRGSHRVFTEFLHKVLWEKDWRRERHRYYGARTADQIRALNREHGLREIIAGPENRPWFEEQMAKNVTILNPSGQELPPPALKYFTIGQKVADSEGIVLTERSRIVTKSSTFARVHSFLEMDAATGAAVGIREIGNRKNVTHEPLAYSLVGKKKILIQAQIRPRPLLKIHDHILDQSVMGGYLVEPLGGVVPSQAFSDLQKACATSTQILEQFGGVDKSDILGFGEVRQYSARPNIVDERVSYQLVQVRAQPDRVIQTKFSDHATAVTVRMFDTADVLETCQLGGLHDARLERAAYNLHYEHGVALEKWSGTKLRLTDQPMPKSVWNDTRSWIAPPKQNNFERLPDRKPGFLMAGCSEFEDRNRFGEVVGEATLEWLSAADFSLNTVPVLPIMRVVEAGKEPRLLVGVRPKSFPDSEGNSCTVSSVPTIHLSRDIRSIPQAKQAVRESFLNKGIKLLSLNTIGGKYFSAPGITPEVMYPMLAEFPVEALNDPGLIWIDPAELIRNRHEMKCGQLQTLAYRLAHAAGTTISAPVVSRT